MAKTNKKNPADFNDDDFFDIEIKDPIEEKKELLEQEEKKESQNKPGEKEDLKKEEKVDTASVEKKEEKKGSSKSTATTPAKKSTNNNIAGNDFPTIKNVIEELQESDYFLNRTTMAIPSDVLSTLDLVAKGMKIPSYKLGAGIIVNFLKMNNKEVNRVLRELDSKRDFLK